MTLVLDKRCILVVMVLDPPLVSPLTLICWFGKALSYLHIVSASVLFGLKEWHPACKNVLPQQLRNA